MLGGDRRCWRVVRVPTLGDEDARHLNRTWEPLHQHRTWLINRLQAMLATLGGRLPVGPECESQVEGARRGRVARFLTGHVGGSHRTWRRNPPSPWEGRAHRGTPDYFALQVMNTMLGGMFQSRLNGNIREEKGYS